MRTLANSINLYLSIDVITRMMTFEIPLIATAIFLCKALTSASFSHVLVIALTNIVLFYNFFFGYY